MEKTTLPPPVKKEQSQKKQTDLSVKLIILIIVSVAFVLIYRSVIKNQKDDNDLVQELEKDFMQNKNSFIHLSAAARICASNTSSAACELLEKAYGEFLTVGYRAPVATPTNINVRQLVSDERIFPMLGHFLRTKKENVGRILSTDRIFDLGKKYFIEMIGKSRMSKIDLKNLEWILLLQGYPLQEWEKNEGYKDVKSLRPQIEKLPADSPISSLETGYNTQNYLRWAGFEKIQDILNFIEGYGAHWENEIKSKGLSEKNIENLRDAMIEAGYGEVFEPFTEKIQDSDRIEVLGIKNRTVHSLKNHKVNDVGDLKKFITKYAKDGDWKENMQKLHGVGDKTTEDIEKCMQQKGFSEFLKKLEN